MMKMKRKLTIGTAIGCFVIWLIPAYGMAIHYLTHWAPDGLPDAGWFSLHLPVLKAHLCAAFIRLAPWMALGVVIVAVRPPEIRTRKGLQSGREIRTVYI